MTWSFPRRWAALFALSTACFACGSIGPTAKAKKKTSDTDLTMQCDPSSIYDCDSLCEQGDLGACEQAGAAYYEGKLVEKDPERAQTLSKKACDDGRPRACGTLGKLAQDGQGELAKEQIARYLDQGCKADDGDACVRLGLVLLEGKGVAKDAGRAHSLFQRACTLEVTSACYELAVSARTGREGFSKDLPRAAQLFTLTCNKDVGDACFHIGQMQWTGEGAQLDTLRAVQNLEKGCQLSSALSCDYLGQLHEAGKGITPDTAKAGKLYDRACKLELDAGCQHYAALLRDGKGVDSDPKKAFALFEKSCKAGDLSGCVEQGKLLREGKGASPDAKKAAESFKKACDGGQLEGCAWLGVQTKLGEGVKADPAAARPLLERGCQNGKTPFACVSLASLLAAGAGGKADPKKAYQYASDACAANDAEGCLVLGRLTEFGDGTERSPHGAAKLYSKACTLGSKEGCAGELALAVQGIGDPAEAVEKVSPACQAGHAESCLALGRAYQTGKGVGKDPARAFTLFKERCEAGNQEGCARQGYLYLTGLGTAQDENKAKKLINGACTAGEATGCYYKTRLQGVSEAEQKKLLENACKGHSRDACKELK